MWAYSTPQPNTEVPAPTGGFCLGELIHRSIWIKSAPHIFLCIWNVKSPGSAALATVPGQWQPGLSYLTIFCHIDFSWEHTIERFNSLAPPRCGGSFKSVILKYIILNSSLNTRGGIGLGWMPQHITSKKSSLAKQANLLIFFEMVWFQISKICTVTR